MPQGETPHTSARDRLATRLALLVFTSCFLTALVVSWVAIQSSRRALYGALERQLPARAAELVERQRSLFERAQAEAAALAPLCAGREPAQTAARLAEALGRASLLGGAACVGADGRASASAGSAGAPYPVAAAPQGIAWVPGAGAARLVATATSARGKGFLAAPLAPHAAVVDHPDASLGPEAQVRLLEPRGPSPGAAGGGVGSGAAALEPLRRVGEERDPDGRRWLAASQPLPGPGGSLLLRVPLEFALAPLHALARQILALNSAVVVLVSLLALRMTRHFVQPIERLCEALRRVAGGALDVDLREPTSDDEVATLTRSFNQMMQRLRRDQDEIQRSHDSLRASNRELQQLNEILSQLSITDGLTRLHNHRFFQDHLTREIKRVMRSGEPLSMLLIDIDDFKALNDRLGHAAGDEVLVRISRILETRLRDCDLLARYGGEEFVVLCSGTDRLGAYQLAESIRTQVSEAVFGFDAALEPARISVSIGVAQFEGNRKIFFGAADRALYGAKAQGKNCVVSDREL